MGETEQVLHQLHPKKQGICLPNRMIAEMQALHAVAWRMHPCKGHSEGEIQEPMQRHLHVPMAILFLEVMKNKAVEAIPTPGLLSR